MVYQRFISVVTGDVVECPRHDRLDILIPELVGLFLGHAPARATSEVIGGTQWQLRRQSEALQESFEAISANGHALRSAREAATEAGLHDDRRRVLRD